eukprot:SRR837773.3535.p1 GENE.SRR837773.3535~~SRR837773.3535.p1  ORF type:complete len:287 (-),score=114.62 SRR837773.3535:204-935(-)
MGVSDTIAAKDVERYKNWDKAPRKAACLAMDGPAFQGFEGKSLSPKDRKVAQGKVRILSGLYGVLKPFDAIRPYRLEMGCGLKTSRGKNLYEFWGETIAQHVSQGAKVIVNAASQEYFKAVKPSGLRGLKVVTVDFPGPAVFAKKARGLICRYAVLHNCQKPEDLKKFTGADGDRYAFDAGASTDAKYVFRRVSGSGAGRSKALAKAAAKAAEKAAAKAAAKAAPKKRPVAAAAAGVGKRARS